MARLLHLSDLHFGRESPGLVPALLAAARALRPDVTVITGDLTQRARAGQFAAAARLIAALPGPVLAVPGNHDLPLWNPLARFLRPRAAWRRGLALPVEPMVEIAGLRVIGLDTADPWAHERGRIREAALDRACTRLSAARPGQLCIVAMHHPLVQPPETGKAPMVGAAEASEALAGAGADVILCGHLHQWAASPHALREGGRAMLCIQGGTTLSTRLRGEENDFNLVEHHRGEIAVTRYRSPSHCPSHSPSHCPGGSQTFTPDRTTRFRQAERARGWERLPAAPPPSDAPL